MMLPIQRTPVEVPAMDILPFHFGSSRSLMFSALRLDAINVVLNPKLL